MRLVRNEAMPQQGSSQAFVGAEHGGVGLSAYRYTGQPGRAIAPHWHPYLEVHFVEAGRGLWRVGEQSVEAGAGDIVVLEPRDVHGVTVLGDEPLRVIGVHLSSTFVQTEGE